MVELLPDLALLALAFGLRLISLGDANIWTDEGIAIWAARQDLLTIARWTATDVHPPLYFWLLHFWRALVGDGEFAVRFLSVLAGTLTVAALGYLTKVLVPGRPVVWRAGMLFLACSRFAVWWSQETRMYMLAGLLATLSLAFTVRVRWRPDVTSVLGFVVTTVAALWTLYLLSFLLVIESLYWLWTLRGTLPWRQRWRQVIFLLALQGSVLILFLPWLAYAIPRMMSWSVMTGFHPLDYLQLYVTLLVLGVTLHIEAYRLPVLTLWALTVVGLGLHIARSRSGGRPGAVALPILTVIMAPLVVLLITLIPRSFGYVPKPEARYLLPFAPSFYLLQALAIVTIADKVPGGRYILLGGLVAAPLALSAWGLGDYYGQRYPRDEYRSLALTLKAHYRPGDAVVLHASAPWATFAYYWPGPFQGTPGEKDIHPAGVDYFLTPIWESHEAVWLAINEEALAVDPQQLMEGWLAQRAAARHEWRFNSERLVLFARTPARAAGLLALAPGFTPSPPPTPLVGDGLTLAGWEQALTRVHAGDIVHLAAYVWRREAGGTLSVALGNPPLVQATTPIPEGDGLTRIHIQVRIPLNAPAGDFPWRVRLNNSEGWEGTVHVTPIDMPRLEPLPEPRNPVQATFGQPGLIRLLGYDLDGALTPGGNVKVTLYWQAIATPSRSYKVFVHIVNEAGRVAAQRDDYPLGGSRPTNTWRPGEGLLDIYQVPLGPDLMPGTYTLAVGLYDGTTGKRLGPVYDAEGITQPMNQMVLGAITLR